MALWEDVDMGRRSMLLAARFFPTHVLSFSPISSVPHSLVAFPSSSSTKQENERTETEAETQAD